MNLTLIRMGTFNEIFNDDVKFVEKAQRFITPNR